jgi:hypothetical protein
MGGKYGDERRTAALTMLEEKMVSGCNMVVRKLGKGRRNEMKLHRVLSSTEVTSEKITEDFADRTAQAIKGRRIVVAQDTTEVNFPKRTASQLGPGGNGSTAGFFIHAAVAIDAEEESVLGLVEALIWTRKGKVTERHKRKLEEKESYRWVQTAQTVAQRMSAARECIVVGDRESDIYQLFEQRPKGLHLLVRVRHNRKVEKGELLYEAALSWPVLCVREVKVAPRGPGDKGRTAKVELRAGKVLLKAPCGTSLGTTEQIKLTLVEAREIDAPEGVTTPLHWRLLTTLEGTDEAAATDIVGLYRLRWRIEQSFRMLKTHGMNIEETQMHEPHKLFNLSAMAMGCAVRIIQLVDARDGSRRPATDVASPEEIQAAKALVPTLEGGTERQKNPYPEGGLDWLSWIIARLGGWNCYYKPPGPKTMRDGWLHFAAIAQGFNLAHKNV